MSFAKKYLETTLSGVIIIEHSSFVDLRGQLWTTFDKSLSSICPENLIHDKFARNSKGTLRGIHGDDKSWKLVTAIRGEFFQAVVDCRQSSTQFLEHITIKLSGSTPTSILIPPGFGNAFYSHTEDSIYHYKLAYPGDYNDASEQFTYKWNDPRIAIRWPDNDPIISERDA